MYYRILIQDIYTGNSMLVYKVIILCILIIEKRKNIYIYINTKIAYWKNGLFYSLRQETCKITVVNYLFTCNVRILARN